MTTRRETDAPQETAAAHHPSAPASRTPPAHAQPPPHPPSPAGPDRPTRPRATPGAATRPGRRLDAVAGHRPADPADGLRRPGRAGQPPCGRVRSGRQGDGWGRPSATRPGPAAWPAPHAGPARRAGRDSGPDGCHGAADGARAHAPGGPVGRPRTARRGGHWRPRAHGPGPADQPGRTAARPTSRGTEDLCTHRLPLAETPRGYEIFQQKQDGAVSVVLDPARTAWAAGRCPAVRERRPAARPPSRPARLSAPRPGPDSRPVGTGRRGGG